MTTTRGDAERSAGSKDAGHNQSAELDGVEVTSAGAESYPFWIPLAAAGFGSVASAVGFSAIQLALPRISVALQADVSVVEWIPLLQNLLMTGLLLPFGWLGDVIGHRRVFINGLVVLTAGATFSALSPSIEWLLFNRVITAVGTSMMIAVSSAIVVSVVDPRRRGQALGWSMTMTYVGLAVGPSLGGLAMGLGDWQGAMWLSVPVGILALIAAIVWIPVTPKRDLGADSRFDAGGTVLLIVGFGAILLAATRGESWGWTSPSIVGLATAGVGASFGFVWFELRQPQPLLDLRLFRNRLFAAATVSAVLVYIGGWVPPFLVPFYLIDVRGLSPAEAGLIVGVLPASNLFMAPFAGILSDKFGSRSLTVSGMLLLTAGLVALGTLSVNSSHLEILVRLAAVGMGIGLFVVPNTSAMLGSVGIEHRGTAAALTGTARNFGMAVGVAIAGTVYAEATARLAGEGGVDQARLTALQLAFWTVAAITSIGVVTSFVRGTANSVGQ